MTRNFAAILRHLWRAWCILQTLQKMPVSPRDSAPDVFGFLDYREFLRAHYLYKKARGALSFRSFSRRAGLGSPNYLKLVMDGDRNLTAPMAGRFATALGLEPEAARYFRALVQFSQARDVEARNRAYARLKRLRGPRRAERLEAALERYHARWYLPAIRELVTSAAFREDAGWIARQLCPPIRTAQAQEALDTLLELGLLVRDKRGRLRQAEATVTTGPEVRSLHLANYHRTMIGLGQSALERFAGSERDISALTLCVGEAGLAKLKRSLQRMRRELLELAELETDPTQVVQLNLQLFPLSRLATLVDEAEA
jgi:uncharacterized protein (TIGR02147 family)